MKDSIRPWSPFPCSDFCGLSDDRNFTSSRKNSKQEDLRESLMLLLPVSLTVSDGQVKHSLSPKNKKNKKI